MKNRMKKGIALGLVVLLLVAVAGTAFARDYPVWQYVEYYGPSSISIISVEGWNTGLNVTYSASEAVGTVRFTFTTTYRGPLMLNSRTQTWTNTERITRPRNSSTFRFSFVNQADYIEKIVITVE